LVYFSFGFRATRLAILMTASSFTHRLTGTSLTSPASERKVLIREIPFADDATLTVFTEVALQRLITRFAESCDEFGLKKTNMMGRPKNLYR
jgi:hypothetical protein